MNTPPTFLSAAGISQNTNTSLRDLGEGAIAALMAVTFREEKLALRTTGPETGTQAHEKRSFTRRDQA